MLYEDKGLALPRVPGENVLSLGPGGLAWVSGLAPYGRRPAPRLLKGRSCGQRQQPFRRTLAL